MTRDEAIRVFRNNVDKESRWDLFTYNVEELIHSIYDFFEKESCQDCIYLGVDTDICLKCSHSYSSKFKRMK